MKIKNLNKNLISSLLLVVSGITGFYTGIVLFHYEIVVKGVLGLTNYFLIYLLFFPPKDFGHKPTDTLHAGFPKDIKYIVVVFFLSIVVCWSGLYLANAIRYLINMVKLGA
jgi:hypothetical protein